MKLPVSIKFHHGETPLSFASRLAAANGYPSLDAFLQCTDTTALAIARGEDEAIALLNKWTGENQDALRHFAVRRVKEQLRFKLGDAIFGKDHRRGETHRFCVRCVQDDIRNGEGRKGSRAYVRAWWETKAIKTCPSHGTGITEVACERHGHDFSLFVRQNEALFDNEWVDQKAKHARTLDQYLLGRIYGDTGNGFLDSLDAYVVTGLCEYFGRLMRRYEAMREPENPEMDDAE
jgi:TniQ